MYQCIGADGAESRLGDPPDFENYFILPLIGSLKFGLVGLFFKIHYSFEMRPPSIFSYVRHYTGMSLDLVCEPIYSLQFQFMG
jgi:hypothetical protein